ncbi:MAG: UDP-N-acetylmuramoyl-tripeptide--D-alanyl-D-alanine ligase [Candidatus Omnitrophica bacterium]|nr:UDP-N-acetylmuramoyl-tripeptide--D-alanyl-D-alanine ligase [Candidatus Omnitrophota bacterium]
MRINIRDIIDILKPAKVFNVDIFGTISGFSIDTRTILPGEVYIAIKGELKDGHDYIDEALSKGACGVIAEAGSENLEFRPVLLVDSTKKAVEEIIKYILKNKNVFIYAVTGSVGKTTTKEMLAYLLNMKFSVWSNHGTENNLLGLAKTIFSLKEQQVLINELGTNAPGEIKLLSEILQPNAGIITFIKPVHLERLGTIEGVFREKCAMFKSNTDMQVVLNRDDGCLAQVSDNKNVYWFGMQGKGSGLFNRYVYADLLGKTNSESLFLVQGKYKLRLKTPFDGYIYNALAAIAAAGLKGISVARCAEFLSDFELCVTGRMEILELNGIKVINDAYNANPYSFEKALEFMAGMPGDKIMALGDMLELGLESIEYRKALAENVMDVNPKFCFTVGENMYYLNRRLLELGFRWVKHFHSVEAMGNYIKTIYEPGNLILLKGSRNMRLERIIEFL